MSDLLMPKLGLTMNEGLLSEWHVAAGDTVSAGDALYTVETEKVANEIEAEVDGVIGEISVAAGETVPIGTTVAHMQDAQSSRSPKPEIVTASAEVVPGTTVQQPTTQTESKNGRIFATPLARRIAAQENVDLRRVAGSGPRDRIKAADVQANAECAGAQEGATTVAASRVVTHTTRQATANRVSAAKRDIPHFYVTHEAEISQLEILRTSLNRETRLTRISVTQMLIKALGLALHQMPLMNRIWTDGQIFEFSSVDIGLVVETENGLRVPVLRNIAHTSLDDLADNTATVLERARNGILEPNDVGDSVMSISNVGMFGVSSLTPIINPPGAMILGVGAAQHLFRPDGAGNPVARYELTLTLAADHRIIDGADAARFLSLLVSILENPFILLRPAITG